MGLDEDHIAANREAPDTADEWRIIRAGVDKAHKAWVIVGPLYAVVINWKALIIVGLIVVYINNPAIVAGLRVLAGVKE